MSYYKYLYFLARNVNQIIYAVQYRNSMKFDETLDDFDCFESLFSHDSDDFISHKYPI